MADSVGLTISQNGIEKTLSGMLSRSGLVRGWLNRVGYPMVIQAQRMRWASEGATEGDSWKPLNPSYAIQKLKRFKDFPGGGTKMLIATGRLVDSVTGDNTAEHYKLVTDESLEVGTRVPYAKYVDEERDFHTLSVETEDNIRSSLKAYLQGR